MIERRKLVYLASPYTHADPKVVESRIRAFALTAASIEKSGEAHVVSGLHNHLLGLYTPLPGDFAFWGSYSLTVLERCDEVLVLRLPGWAESTGVQGEIRAAKDKGIPISYADFNED